jgi:hypothetical protein
MMIITVWLSIAACLQNGNEGLIPQAHDRSFEGSKEVGRVVGNDQISVMRLKYLCRKNDVSFTYWSHYSEFGDFYGLDAQSSQVDKIKSLIGDDADLRSNINIYGSGVDGGRFLSRPIHSFSFKVPLSRIARRSRIGSANVESLYRRIASRAASQLANKSGAKPSEIVLYERPGSGEFESTVKPLDIFIRYSKKESPDQVHRFQIIYPDCLDCGEVNLWPRSLGPVSHSTN